MIYFLSDIHLGADYIADRRAHEQLVVDFLRSIEHDATALYLLGDILDYWYEYRAVVPRGYVRFFGQLAAMADRGCKIVWLTGNHDIWLFDYLRDELGITVLDAGEGVTVDILGTQFFISHGDIFGRQPMSYRCLRAIFHNKICQRLYASLHPRWTIPFAHGWSSRSRKAGKFSVEKISSHSNETVHKPAFSGRARAAVETRARRLIKENPNLRYIVMGHHHVALDEPLTASCRLIILGNWITRTTYATFDGTTLTLHEYTL